MLNTSQVRPTQPPKRLPSPVAPVGHEKGRDDKLLLYFLAVQFLCQALLMVERLGAFRMGFRAATFLSSIGMVILLSSRPARPHPVCRLAAITLLILATGLLHPETIIISGMAHLAFNASIWAPLFWVGRLSLSSRGIWNILQFMWVFHTVSAVVGVLQTYYPETFAPSANFVQSLLGERSESLLINLADGRRVWRPFGLSDSPGGAASSGSLAIIIGLVLVTKDVGIVKRLVAAIGIAAGIFCIYICQIRVILVITLLSALVMIIVQFLQGRLTRVAGMLLLIPAVLVGGIVWTQDIGGDAVTKRVRTLTEDTPTAVYYKNRGAFVEHTFASELPKYPLGAGLGRYGMMYTYFGDKRIRPLHVEVQITGWLYDAGLLMVALGYAAVLATCFVTFRIATSRTADPLLVECALIIASLNCAWLAVTFSYALFLSQGGMMFWLLNAALYTAAQSGGKRVDSAMVVLKPKFKAAPRAERGDR